MKSSKVLQTNKRSASPGQPPKSIQISDRKKKPSSTINQLTSNIKKGMKQFQKFETYGKSQKKRNNYLKQLLRNNGQSTNKYRIVTEPVQDRLMYLGNNNYGNIGNNSHVMNSRSNNRLDSKNHINNHNFNNNNNNNDPHTPLPQKSHSKQRYVKLNIRTSNNSKQKLRTGQSFHRLDTGGSSTLTQQINNCKNCQKYKQQLDYLKKQINSICMDKVLWKNSQMSIEDIKKSFFHNNNNNTNTNTNNNRNMSNKNNDNNNNIASTQSKSQLVNHIMLNVNSNNSNKNIANININNNNNNKQHQSIGLRLIQKQLLQLKRHFYDLMKDVQSLSGIDYPKMLSLNIFKPDPFYSSTPGHQQAQLKQLLSQLRTNMQGKIHPCQLSSLSQFQYTTTSSSSNQYNKKIIRNMKNRLGYLLRQNFELKMRKEILERSQEITAESEDYLKKVIQDVILSYAGEQ